MHPDHNLQSWLSVDQHSTLHYTHCMFRLLALFALIALAPFVSAQWEMEESNSTASLRGIVSVGGGVAWASGTGGTVLRTEDGGYVWQGCVAPPDSTKLDFRAIQAWDENTAVVMSSGPGDLSRLYRTTDGCRTWKRLLTNPDKEGFWDALQFTDRQHGTLLGDPVDGHFVLLTTSDGGATWTPLTVAAASPVKDLGVFAASNSSLLMRSPSSRIFCTGGKAGAMVIQQGIGPQPGTRKPGEIGFGNTSSSEELISFDKSETSGCFSLATSGDARGIVVAVGGDYAHPEQTDNIAWTTASADDPENKQHPLFRFAPAKVKPAGYRSAVAFNAQTRSWIAVGPGGTDLSNDDGQTWRPLKPGPQEAQGADMQWNALSLPFAVGPHGRIGKLRGEAFQDNRSPTPKEQ